MYLCVYNLHTYFGCLFQNTTSLSKEDKFHHSKYLLKRLLPFVRKFNEQQNMEKKMEAKIRGNAHNWLEKISSLLGNAVKYLYHFCVLLNYLVRKSIIV